MNSDEEYLDDLLKSIMEGEEDTDDSIAEQENAEDTGSEETTEPADLDFAITDHDISDDGMTYDDTENGLDDFAIEDFGVVEPEPGELADDEPEEEENGEKADTMETEDSDSSVVDDVMGADAGDINNTDVLEANDNSSHTLETAGEEEEAGLLSSDELDAMFAAADSAATEEKTAEGVMAEDDMLALLESMSEEAESSDAQAEDVPKDSDEKEEVSSKDKKKKGFFSKFSDKKKKEDTEKKEAEDGINDEQTVESDELSEAVPEQETGHKNGFFSKILTFLTEADDEMDEAKAEADSGMEPSAENKNILEELKEEDKKKKKKKVKGKKGQQEENPDEEKENEEDPKEKKKEKKKEKRKKKKEKAASEVTEVFEETKPGKKVSKKNVAIVVGLCLTLAAMIFVLCSIVPGFFDKRQAREAYYQSDYAKSYELLYGKKLDNSDTIIFNKSKIILELKRKLDSYHNYLGIGKEVQALDALMSGVEKYPEIRQKAEEYHVTQEVDAVYETILNILNDKYDISETVAKVIIDYDDLTYTRKLESVVNKTPFVKPGEEEPANRAADILPEEQSMIDETMETEETAEEPEAIVEETAADAVENTAEDTADQTAAEEVPAGNEEALDAEASASENVTEELPVASEENNAPEENTDTAYVEEETSDNQGQLIQGVRQPINFQIHGN